MKIISYNVNGIRSAIKKGFLDWLKTSDADVVQLQEIKASEGDFDVDWFRSVGYESACFSAEKKGYSGVALLFKKQPDAIVKGFGNELIDREGRMIRADFGDISICSLYLPSGTTGDIRQAFKMECLAYFTDYVNELRKSRPNLIIGGDYNICRTKIDIHDPVSNKNSSGFKPEEREWFAQFLETGMVDSFRQIHPEALHQYSWWSYRAGARNNNKGWRIDYQLVTPELAPRIKNASIMMDVVHSDHCPIYLEIE